MVFEPLCHQVLSCRGTLLVVGEAGSLELAAVLLEIDNKDAFMADSSVLAPTNNAQFLQ